MLQLTRHKSISYNAISFPEPAFPLTSDRETQRLWANPKQEPESGSGLIVRVRQRLWWNEKFFNSQLYSVDFLAGFQISPKIPIPGADQKDRGLWVRDCVHRVSVPCCASLMRQVTLQIFIARSILIGCEKNKNWPEVKNPEVSRALLLKARYAPCKQKSDIFGLRFTTFQGRSFPDRLPRETNPSRTHGLHHPFRRICGHSSSVLLLQEKKGITICGYGLENCTWLHSLCGICSCCSICKVQHILPLTNLLRKWHLTVMF